MTDFLQVTDMTESQASKYLTHNNAVHRLAVMSQIIAKDRDLTTAPAASNGDVYIVKSSTTTGTWSSKGNKVAIYDNGWVFLTPVEGWSAYIQDENVDIIYDGSAWKLKHPEQVAQTLTCSSIVTFNAKLGSIGLMTFNRASATVSFSNAYSGQPLKLVLKQSSTGGNTVSFYSSQIRASTSLPSTTPLSTGANKVDYLGFVYHGGDSKYDYVAMSKGY